MSRETNDPPNEAPAPLDADADEDQCYDITDCGEADDDPCCADICCCC